MTNAETEGVPEQMDSLASDNGYLYFDMRNRDKFLQERNCFYLYPPFFQVT